MEKPIIATTISGLFLKHEPWDNAHILWFKDAAEKLEDESVNDWADKPDYFKGVESIHNLQELKQKLKWTENIQKQ